jgi:hypothetical protein
MMDRSDVLYRMRVAQQGFNIGRALIAMLNEANRLQREFSADQLQRIAQYQPMEFPLTLGWRAPFFVVAPAVRWEMTLMTRGVDVVETRDAHYESYICYLSAHNSVGATCMFAVRPGGERTTLLNLAVFWLSSPDLPESFTIDGKRHDPSTMNPLFSTLLRIDQAVIEAVQTERADSEDAIRIKPPLPRYTCAADWPAIFLWVQMYEPRMTNSDLAERLGFSEKTVANSRNKHQWLRPNRGGRKRGQN